MKVFRLTLYDLKKAHFGCFNAITYNIYYAFYFFKNCFYIICKQGEKQPLNINYMFDPQPIDHEVFILSIINFIFSLTMIHVGS